MKQPVDEEEKFRIADDRLRSKLAVAQEWTCAGCGADLVAGAVTVVYAAPSESEPADIAPVLVHESCADEQRTSFRDWGDARETLGPAGDPAAAKRALEAAVAVHRDAVNAVVEQATAPLHAKIEGLQTKNREMKNKNRELERQNAELKQSVYQLRENVQDVLTKNGKWSQAFKQQTASRQALEHRIKNCIEAMKNRRFISREEVIATVVEHLQPQRAQA